LRPKNPLEMERNLLRSIGNFIQDAQRVLVVTHVGPDGDAIGSLLSMGQLLDAEGKDRVLFCQDPVPEGYQFLPGSDEITQQAEGTFDLIISLDCSDRYRMGDEVSRRVESLQGSVPLINVDHHITNTRFGTLNWVEPGAVATTQMILELVGALDWELTPPLATCLLNGLITDTRSFRTSNVDSRAVRAALQLMEAGASLSQVTRHALEQRSLASVRVWGQAIEQLHLEDGILWTVVTRAMRQRLGLDGNDVSGLANFLSGIREADVVVVFTERENGTIDVGLRAAPGLDVTQAALQLGGGGHPQASGCTLSGPLAQVQDRVLEVLRRSMAEQGSQAS
jgi:phosphoesterase RecJ-like protein